MFSALRRVHRFADASEKNRASTKNIEKELNAEEEMQRQDTSLATQQELDAIRTAERLEVARQAKARLDEQLFIKKSSADAIMEKLDSRQLDATIAKDRLDVGASNYSKDGHTNIFQHDGLFKDTSYVIDPRGPPGSDGDGPGGGHKRKRKKKRKKKKKKKKKKEKREGEEEEGEKEE